MQKRIREHLRTNVIAWLALFLALTGGVAWANHPGGANTITSGDIVNGEVKTGDIGDLEVRANDVAADSLGSSKIANGSVKNIDLGAGASSSNTIADGGIQGIDVKNNTLTGAQIDESTLTGVASTNAWGLTGNAGTSAANFLGTTDNQPLNLRVNDARALRLEPASDGTNQSPNVIAGIADNQVTPGVHSATIAGGGRFTPPDPATANEVTDNFGSIGGGAGNQAGDDAGTPDDHTLATVGGGSENTASGLQSTVGGGGRNLASGQRATVVGGFRNRAQGDFSLAAGSDASANHAGAFVWADPLGFNFASTTQNQFSVRATGGTRLVSGIDLSGNPTSGLELPAGTSGWSTLVNGQPFDVRVNGARGLRIDPASDGTNQSPNVILGSADNSVASGVHSATIGGGGSGTPLGGPATANRVTDDYGTVGGGAANQASHIDTVGGGWANIANGGGATVAGGDHNAAGGIRATVAGGNSNHAPGGGATVGGGFNNLASGGAATVPGGDTNVAQGDYSLAAGVLAQANHHGAFVWADTNPFDFASTAADQFSVRSTGGARFVSAIDVNTGAPTAGVELAAGGGSWSSLSDAASKRAVEPVSGREVLRSLASVPISTWGYRSQDESIRHIGPMAQDFFRAFGVGEDRRHISSVDADGVALAAIKGLHRELRAERRRRHEQERRLARLEARLARLERAR